MVSTPQGWLSGGHEDRLAQVNATFPSLFMTIVTFFFDRCIGTTLQTVCKSDKQLKGNQHIHPCNK